MLAENNLVRIIAQSEGIGVNFEGGALKKVDSGCPSPSSGSRLGSYLTMSVNWKKLEGFYHLENCSG